MGSAVRRRLRLTGKTVRNNAYWILFCCILGAVAGSMIWAFLKAMALGSGKTEEAAAYIQDGILVLLASFCLQPGLSLAHAIPIRVKGLRKLFAHAAFTDPFDRQKIQALCGLQILFLYYGTSWDF